MGACRRWSIAVLVAVVACRCAVAEGSPASSLGVFEKNAARKFNAVISDTANSPVGVTICRRLRSCAVTGLKCFRETGAHGAITYEVIEDRPGELFVSEIATRPAIRRQGRLNSRRRAQAPGFASRKRARCATVNLSFVARYIFGHAGSDRRLSARPRKKLGRTGRATGLDRMFTARAVGAATGAAAAARFYRHRGWGRRDQNLGEQAWRLAFFRRDRTRSIASLAAKAGFKISSPAARLGDVGGAVWPTARGPFVRLRRRTVLAATINHAKPFDPVALHARALTSIAPTLYTGPRPHRPAPLA